MLTRLLALMILAGCSSSKPTPYQKEKKKEGYHDDVVDGLNISRFRANSSTKKELAQVYAQFRAIENCHANSKKVANIIDIFDKTIEKNIVRSSGTSWGPTYFGSYPYYSRHSSFGLSAGFDTISSNSWNETLVYPVIEVYYTCNEVVVRPQLIFKELTSEQMKHLVKDVKGALQLDKIFDNSPNLGILESGDIILKANGKRVERVYELIRLFQPEQREVSVVVLREGVRVIKKLRSVDITSQVKKTEDEIILSVCKPKKNQSAPSYPLCLKL